MCKSGRRKRPLPTSSAAPAPTESADELRSLEEQMLHVRRTIGTGRSAAFVIGDQVVGFLVGVPDPGQIVLWGDIFTGAIQKAHSAQNEVGSRIIFTDFPRNHGEGFHDGQSL